MNQLPICIAGAGIGGLTAAYALQRFGFSVKLIERARTLRPVGAGITLQINAMSALKHIGLADQVAPLGNEVRGVVARHRSGQPRATVDLSELSSKLRVPCVCIHRAELQAALLAAIDSSCVWFGTEIESVAPEENQRHILVRTSKGDEIKAAALIGADGVHSSTLQLLGKDGGLQADRYRCWRGIGRRPESLKSDEGNGWWGHGMAFGCFPLPNDQLYWYATESANHATKPKQPADQYLLDQFADWDSVISECIDNTASETIFSTPLTQRRPERQWGSGLVTLLGDAAHPMTPSMGQGGGQAIEDAVVLANCFCDSALAKSIPHCLRNYERLRYERTDRMVTLSDRMTRVAHGEGLIDRMTRSLLPYAPTALRKRQLRWLYEFGYTGG